MSVIDTLQRTNWPLFAQQKASLVGLLNDKTVTPERLEHLEGILNWIDVVQDAADGEGLPVFIEGAAR